MKTNFCIENLIFLSDLKKHCLVSRIEKWTESDCLHHGLLIAKLGTYGSDIK